MKRFAIVWIGVCSILSASTVQAHVLPPSYVLRQWLEKLENVRTLHVKQTVTSFGSSSESRQTTDEEIWISRPQRYRKTITSSGGTIHEILGSQRAVRIQQGRTEVVGPADILGPLGMVYLATQSKEAGALLRQGGINSAESHWHLLDEVLSLGIGTKSGNRVLFLKNEWLPVGAVLGGKSYRFLSTGDTRFRVPYPDSIDVYENQKHVARIDIKLVKPNEKIDENIFDVSVLTRRS